jgi:hypothetical protein
MSGILNKLIADISAQKAKYHAKVLSVDGEWSLFMRDFQIYDFAIDISELLIPEFYFASLSNSLLFGFDLTDIEPFNLEFDWRFPTLEEWENGINVVIDRILSPAATDLETFIMNNIQPIDQQPIMSSALSKGIYGVSTYGNAYYDPAAVAEFLRNVITLMFKKHPDFPQRKVKLMSLVNALNVNEDVARSVHDRMSMIMSAHTECFILDYGMLNITNLCQESPINEMLGVVPFIDLDGNYREAAVLTLDDMQAGCILDMTPLDYCYLMPDRSIYVNGAPVLGLASDPSNTETIWESVDDKINRFMGRYMLTSAAFSNYNRGDEAADHTRSERTNVWGELMAGRYNIERMVQNTLSQLAPDLDPMRARAYVTAVLQLIGYRGKRHEWGFGTFKAMSQDELKNWWTQYWSSQGLDANVLGQLFDRLAPYLDAYVKKKVEMGASVRLKRLGR